MNKDFFLFSFLFICFVATMHLFSQSLSIVLRCLSVLLNVIFSFSSARCTRWTGFALVRLSCRCVIDVMLLHCVIRCMLYNVNSLLSASVRVRHTRAVAAAHLLESISINQWINALFRNEHYREHQNILTAIHDHDWSVNLPSGSRQGRLLLYSFNINYISNIKVIPRYSNWSL